VPHEITQGMKKGFSAPDASWFRGESIDYVKAMLIDGKARLFDYFDAAVVRQLVGEHIEGRENRRLFIWSLLSLEHWCRTFVGRVAAAA
jgi:asparagine synthase (glutamine-hydrolysing)